MRKYLKNISVLVLPIFMFGMLVSCTEARVNTAKNVMTQADFYMDMAEALVKVATTQFPNNQKVTAALKATAQALSVVKNAMSVAKNGLDKDNTALKATVVALIVEVFVLFNAIKEAKNARTSP
jgi:hypothetical protein